MIWTLASTGRVILRQEELVTSITWKIEKNDGIWQYVMWLVQASFDQMLNMYRN